MIRRRNKIKVFHHTSILCIGTIAMLNLLGISYAGWENKTNIDLSIATGHIEPYFHDTEKIIGMDKDGYLTVRTLDNGRTVRIEGQVYPSYNENIFLDIGNNGSIPILYKDLKIIEENEMIQQINEPNKNKAIHQEEIQKLKVHLKAKNNNEAIGRHEFVYQLEFEQEPK